MTRLLNSEQQFEVQQQDSIIHTYEHEDTQQKKHKHKQTNTLSLACQGLRTSVRAVVFDSSPCYMAIVAGAR